MLSDLTLEMCTPSFRCNDAHRTQRKMPRFQLAHPIAERQRVHVVAERAVTQNLPGLRVKQSAQRSLPGCFNNSWSVFSLRACWRLFMTAAIAHLKCEMKLNSSRRVRLRYSRRPQSERAIGGGKRPTSEKGDPAADSGTWYGSNLETQKESTGRLRNTECLKQDSEDLKRQFVSSGMIEWKEP